MLSRLIAALTLKPSDASFEAAHSPAQKSLAAGCCRVSTLMRYSRCVFRLTAKRPRRVLLAASRQLVDVYPSGHLRQSLAITALMWACVQILRAAIARRQRTVPDAVSAATPSKIS